MARVWVDGVRYEPGDEHDRAQLDGVVHELFSDRVDFADLLATCETDDVQVDTLRITRRGDDLFETRAQFYGTDGTLSGLFINRWRRNDDGELWRSGDGRLTINGSRRRLGLQLHANVVAFARESGAVRCFEVEAWGVGRYSYRFMHGAEVDAATRADIGERLEALQQLLLVPIDRAAFDLLRSPREIVDFVVLPRLTDRWMAEVNAIIERRRFNFTVDQVVDVARRPGLALLLDRHSWRMRLDLHDPERTQRLRVAVLQGRERRALQRLTGVLGHPFSQLPEAVRTALITCRPYLFPRPAETPPLPDLRQVDLPAAPWRVRGFRSADGVLLSPEPMDPPETKMRDYRAAEVARVLDAVEAATPVVTVTGLSGSGKTEIMTWNIEKRLSLVGHRVVTLDAQRLARRDDDPAELLRQIDDVVRPTVVLFDESLYLKGELREAVLAFADQFLAWPGQHLLLIGGGRTSPDYQRARIEENLAPLFEQRRSQHVSTLPKPLGPSQVYRFLGLTRLDWASEEQRLALLRAVFERYPPHFVPLMPVRLYEHEQVRSMAQALALLDEHVAPDEWRELAGMELA